MKHLFILNPAAGKGRAAQITNMIYSVAAKLEVSVEIYITNSPGDGEVYSRRITENGEPCRLYACGGDGTLNEVLNGSVGRPNVEIGCIPMGTGNDFIKNFSGDGVGDFLDVEGQILGESVLCDAVTYERDSGVRYFANMLNIGFDCHVVDRTVSIKKKPLINGKLAYGLGVFIELIKKRGAHLSITVDGHIIPAGNILLTAVGNGAYYGGGIKAAPMAKPDDGLIDVSVVKDLSRSRFTSLFPVYRRGDHIYSPKAADLVKYNQCLEVEIRSEDGTVLIAVDGELQEAKWLRISAKQGAFRFVVPATGVVSSSLV